MGAQRYGDETACTSFGQELSYREVHEEANCVANLLGEHDVEPDDRVGLSVPNTLQFPEEL